MGLTQSVKGPNRTIGQGKEEFFLSARLQAGILAFPSLWIQTRTYSTGSPCPQACTFGLELHNWLPRVCFTAICSHEWLQFFKSQEASISKVDKPPILKQSKGLISTPLDVIHRLKKTINSEKKMNMKLYEIHDMQQRRQL